MADFSELINCEECGSSFVLTVVDADLEVSACPFCKSDLTLDEEDDLDEEDEDADLDE